MNASTIRVVRSIERVNGEVRFKDPETKRSRRTVPLPAFVAERLRRHRLEQEERYLALGLGRPKPETLVFEREGQPWVPNTFSLSFARIVQNAGLQMVRLHYLRHTFASMALASGVDLKTVSTALGHSTISTTADIYAHVTPSLLQSAAETLDKSLGGAFRASGDRDS